MVHPAKMRACMRACVRARVRYYIFNMFLFYSG